MKEKIKISKGKIQAFGTKIASTIIENRNARIEFPANAIDRMVIDRSRRILNYPVKHLNNIRYTIPFSHIKRQAEYADNICRGKIRTLSFIKEQMDSIVMVNDYKLFEQFTATSVGNLAYIALHAPKIYAHKATQILIHYKEYVRELKK